ncbi:MAG: OB-fold nucleic acid binding domain-containing protein [Candidatus Aenigmatarchaeota archaeon]
MVYGVKPLLISEIKKSTFKKGVAEEKKPSYIITKYGEKVVKPLIVGTVVDKYSSENYMRLTVNDESDSINLRIFNVSENVLNIEIGDTVMAWGKVRETSERFIRVDFIKKIDENMEKYLKSKLLKRLKEKESFLRQLLEYSEIMSYEEFKDFCKENFDFDEEQVKEVLKNKVSEEKILEIFKKLGKFTLIEISNILNLSEEVILEILEKYKKEGIIKEENGYYEVL